MASLDWEECGCILKQLQIAAQIVHRNLSQPTGSESKRVLRTLLPEILSCLQKFRQTVNDLFLQSEHENMDGQFPSRPSSSDVEEQLDHIADLLSATQVCTDCKIPTSESIQQERLQKIQEELATVAQVNDILSRHNLNSDNQGLLKDLVTRQRHLEQQLSFHQGLVQAQQKLSGPDSNYSAENFAYGSTPFPTWLNLFTQSSVLNIVARKQATLTVFGSSSGSLLFFAALTLGLHSIGVEILPFLHNIAEHTRKELQIPTSKCRFICADMLNVPIRETSILLLTSQCWDLDLYQQLRRKLEDELPPGSLVIDYKNALQNSPQFQLLYELPHQRVSWNNRQSLFIFERI